MKFVLDSSVALKWVLPEAGADKAIRLRDQHHHSVHELLAPEVFPVEILHVLTKAERQNRITDAWILWQSVMADVPALYPHAPLMQRAYQIAAAARIGIYDCLYVALAELENCELITADFKLVGNLQGAFPFIRELSTMP